MSNNFLTISELRNLSEKDLQAELLKSRDELKFTKLSVVTVKEKNVSLVKKLTKYIARILTILKETEQNEIIESARQVKTEDK